MKKKKMEKQMRRTREEEVFFLYFCVPLPIVSILVPFLFLVLTSVSSLLSVFHPFLVIIVFLQRRRRRRRRRSCPACSCNNHQVLPPTVNVPTAFSAVLLHGSQATFRIYCWKDAYYKTTLFGVHAANAPGPRKRHRSVDLFHV